MTYKSNSNLTLDFSQPLYLGIDVHKINWSISFIHCDVHVGRYTIPGDIESLKKLLHRFKGLSIYSVYEAGFSGFHLHKQLTAIGIKNIITPPNKIPEVIGDRVKTDKKDSLKLAMLLSKKMLTSIYIPSDEQINFRQLLRTREQIVIKRRSIINQIKSILIQYGIKINKTGLKNKDIEKILTFDLPEYIKLSIKYLAQEMNLLTDQSKNLIKESKSTITNENRENYNLIKSVPGIGSITALALLYEIGDWKRFSNKKKISAFLGLTPSEYSSGDKNYKGRITGQGNSWLRSLLIEASWILIRKDAAMNTVFLKICTQTKSKKKAIVAIARRLICRIHAMIINHQEYEKGRVL